LGIDIKMKATLPVSGLLLFLAQHGHAAMGPAFSTGPVGSGSWIREATSTLVVPNPPNTIVGNTVLWTGMGTDLGDLIQAINNNYPADDLCVTWYPHIFLSSLRAAVI
jgi:hypothetical protein